MRKDRNLKARGGGDFIAVRKHFDKTLLPDLETNCEIVWAKVQISASKSLTLGCFYRPPDSKISTSEELVKSLDLMPKKSNQTIVLGGDFNLPGIDWDNGVVNPTVVQNPARCVSSKRLIGKLSGNKLVAAGPPFQKTVPAVLLMKIG